MKKKNVLLAKMSKKTSKNGNTYFAAKPEKHIRYVLVQHDKEKNEHGEEIWHLLMSDH